MWEAVKECRGGVVIWRRRKGSRAWEYGLGGRAPDGTRVEPVQAVAETLRQAEAAARWYAWAAEEAQDR